MVMFTEANGVCDCWFRDPIWALKYTKIAVKNFEIAKFSHFLLEPLGILFNGPLESVASWSGRS